MGCVCSTLEPVVGRAIFLMLERQEVADSAEKLRSQRRARNATKTDLSDRPWIDDRDLGTG